MEFLDFLSLFDLVDEWLCSKDVLLFLGIAIGSFTDDVVTDIFEVVLDGSDGGDRREVDFCRGAVIDVAFSLVGDVDGVGVGEELEHALVIDSIPDDASSVTVAEHDGGHVVAEWFWARLQEFLGGLTDGVVVGKEEWHNCRRVVVVEEFALLVVSVVTELDELFVSGGVDVEPYIAVACEGDARDESGSRTYEHGLSP